MRLGLAPLSSDQATYIAHVAGYGDFDIGSFPTLADAIAWASERFGLDFISVDVKTPPIAEPPYTLPVEVFETEHGCVYPYDFVGPLPPGCVLAPEPTSVWPWLIGGGLIVALLSGASYQRKRRKAA